MARGSTQELATIVANEVSEGAARQGPGEAARRSERRLDAIAEVLGVLEAPFLPV